MKSGELEIRYDFTTQPDGNSLNAALINVLQQHGYGVVSCGGGQEPGIACIHACMNDVLNKRRVVPSGTEPEGLAAAKKRVKAEAKAAAKAARKGKK
jgi:hypothetical protein